MARFFTYCWQHDEMLRYRDGAPVVFAYGSQFARRGVCPGDEIYIVSVHHGRVYLLSKMLVWVVTHSPVDFARYAQMEPAAATEYLVAEAYTPARLVPLPVELARTLRFVRGNQLIGLTFRSEDMVDRQGLRSVRQLSPPSAASLDQLLPRLVRYHPGKTEQRPADRQPRRSS